MGDIPDADITPPENVLFVCKLNPHTTDEDLELIFSRFGEILRCAVTNRRVVVRAPVRPVLSFPRDGAVTSCEIIRDFKTGDSLNYAFIEFSQRKSCDEAYKKMNNVSIDDRRIKVDFSQSVAKLWNKYNNRPRDDKKGGRGGGGGDGACMRACVRVHSPQSFRVLSLLSLFPLLTAAEGPRNRVLRDVCVWLSQVACQARPLGTTFA